ncbi:serine protease snk-like isoform X1 [Epargyreus clarus]|uniref:serine protease snk-like isoform X1 n=1 Tax=Epargyreus clarus TaxID=520877 RepID=UPI003C2B37E6
MLLFTAAASVKLNVWNTKVFTAGALGWLNTARNWTFMCGSSLISRNFVLTAAHCSWVSPRQFNLIDPKPQIVRLGNKNLLEVNRDYYLDVTIQEIIVHPAYKSPLKYFDIALMKLAKDVVFDLYMMPACLWRDATVEPGTEVDATGWGYTSEAVKNMSAELQVVKIKIIDSIQCDEIIKTGRSRNFKGVRSHQICAGVLEGGVDTCQGDSGGPIQIKGPQTCSSVFPLSTVIGVTSFGFGCARAGMPSVYTRVSSYIDWIEENVWKQELLL